MRYQRQPQRDRRIKRGDDFAGDAWLDTKTGQIVYGVVGYDYNSKTETDEQERAQADLEKQIERGFWL